MIDLEITAPPVGITADLTAPIAPGSVVVTAGIVGPQGVPGPTGPQGPPGAAFEFTQAAPSAVWVVAHSLGFKPSVSVASVGGVIVTAEVAHLSDNALEIRFNVPFAGTAHLV